jgi:aspartate aminotransferase
MGFQTRFEGVNPLEVTRSMTDIVAERVTETEPPAVARVLDKARQLEAGGAELTYLVRGEPDFDTPDHIRQAAIEALQAGHTHYAPTQGIPQLRQAVANRLWRDFELSVDSDEEVIITTGAPMGIYLAIQAIIDPGNEVIIFNPVYDPYPIVVRMAGGMPIQVPTQEQKGHFSVSREVIEGALTERSKAILINNPWNPTGSVMSTDELLSLVDLAETYDLILIADEIYEKITFDGHKHHRLASLSTEARARTITVNSFSKTYAMTGWRLGYNIAPPAITRAMLRIVQQFSRSAATFVQFAGIAALDGPQDAVDLMVNAYARRRELVTRSLSHIDVMSFHPPEGTFFALVDVRPFRKSSQSVADYLLEHANVVTIPGGVYGMAGEGYIRLSFAYQEDTLHRGIEAIVRALEQL